MGIKVRNMTELAKDIQKRLNNDDISTLGSLKTKDGVSFAKSTGFVKVTETKLEAAAEALKEYLYKWMKHYFDTYEPKIYQRTGRFLESLLVEVINYGSKLWARVYFDDGKSYRESLWQGQPQGYLPALFNDGWQVQKGWHRDIPHFGYFGGAGFIESAVAEAKKDKQFRGMKIITIPSRDK